jgi:hypothetical protein
MNEACWEGYKQIGMKKKGNRTVPNCVKKNKFSFAEWLNENKETCRTWNSYTKYRFGGSVGIILAYNLESIFINI